MDSFDPSLFSRLYQLVIDELPPASETEIHYFKSYEKMLDEINILVQSKKLRKDSIDS